MRPLLPLLLLLGLLVAPTALSQSKSSKKVQTLRKNLSSVQSKKSKIRSQIRAKQRAAKAVYGDIERVDQRLGQIETAIETTQSKLNRGRQEQERLRLELVVASNQLVERRAQLARRMRSLYMEGPTSNVVALVRSQDLGDLAARKAILERIADHDRALFDSVVALKRTISDRKNRQDRVVAQIAELKIQQQDHQSNLQDARREKKSFIQELGDEANALREQLDQLERESNLLAAQIRRYQAASKGTPFEVRPSRGGLLRPVTAGITSGFGYRHHPILKRRKLHTGIDFGAKHGSLIRAAADGIVISATYMRGYGNTVIIDHGGGLSTLYGHCSRLYVSTGKRVRQGDRIAAVGSTGLSTGPHLHFETRINGTPVNPLSRL